MTLVYVLFHIDRYLVRWVRRKYKHLRVAPKEQQTQAFQLLCLPLPVSSLNLVSSG